MIPLAYSTPLPGQGMVVSRRDDGRIVAAVSASSGEVPVYSILPASQGRGLLLRTGWARAWDALQELAVAL